MPIDLDEWWAQRFLANIDKLSWRLLMDRQPGMDGPEVRREQYLLTEEHKPERKVRWETKWNWTYGAGTLTTRRLNHKRFGPGMSEWHWRTSCGDISLVSPLTKVMFCYFKKKKTTNTVNSVFSRRLVFACFYLTNLGAVCSSNKRLGGCLGRKFRLTATAIKTVNQTVDIFICSIYILQKLICIHLICSFSWI